MLPVSRGLLFLSLACAALLGAAPAEAQPLQALIARDSLDWRPWDARARPTAAELRRLGVCEQIAVQGAHGFHWMDADGDGRPDLVYSTFDTRCREALEGQRTTVYLDRGARLAQAFETSGVIVHLSRAAPWEPVTMVVRRSGCCGDPFFTLATYTPRRAGGNWRWEETSSVTATSETAIPRDWLRAPRPFTVSQDAYRLRTTPVVDDTTQGAMDAGMGRRGNTQATYARGARGVAYAERAGMDGRTWWFVVMPGAPADPAEHRPRGGQMGWMSSRFLTADPATPAGRVDRNPTVDLAQ